jgi:hypothetical protein
VFRKNKEKLINKAPGRALFSFINRLSCKLLYFASMKKTIPVIPFLLLLISACNNDRTISDKSENDVDAARYFIQAALNGNYEKASTYMLKDSANEEWMRQVERVPISPEDKKGLASASILIHEIKKINDTATIVIYSNSFKNNWDTLRVLKQKDQWLVDFNYLFTHDNDSIWAKKPEIKDSIPE